MTFEYPEVAISNRGLSAGHSEGANLSKFKAFYWLVLAVIVRSHFCLCCLSDDPHDIGKRGKITPLIFISIPRFFFCEYLVRVPSPSIILFGNTAPQIDRMEIKKNTKKFGWQPRRMHNKHQSQSQIENVHTHIDTHANMLRECSKDGNEEKKNTEKSH